MTSKLMSKIQATEMKVLRLIKGVTRLDRLRNEDIQRELGIDSILTFIERGQLRWYGHVMRMDADRMPKQALAWIPPGKRPVGRPRKRWMDNIKDALEKRGMTVEAVEEDELYLDRSEWRGILRLDN